MTKSESLPLFPLILPKVAFHEKELLPKTSGIYFALDAIDQVLYVGAAQNLWQRWRSHHRHDDLSQNGCVHIAYYLCSIIELNDLEYAMIRNFHPSLNGTWHPCSRMLVKTELKTLKATPETLRMLKLLAALTNERQYSILERLVRQEYSVLQKACNNRYRMYTPSPEGDFVWSGF